MASGPEFPDPADCVGMTVLLRTGDLHTFKDNPRKRPDVDDLIESLQTSGQFKPIVVNVGTHTGRPNEVLAGNHTLLAFRELAERMPFEGHWTAIKCRVVDVDDDRARRIVAVDNRSFDVGEGYDTEELAALLNVTGTTGTGYTDEELDALNESLTPKVDTPPEDGPPEPPNLAQREAAISFTIIFDDEDQQDLWFEWIKWLAQTYPEEDTLAERLIAHLNDTVSERV